jgi:hypothetical protein
MEAACSDVNLGLPVLAGTIMSPHWRPSHLLALVKRTMIAGGEKVPDDLPALLLAQTLTDVADTCEQMLRFALIGSVPKKLRGAKGKSDGDDSDGFAWRRFAGIATSLLGWRVNDFWSSTPTEFWDAYAVWAESNGMTESAGINGDDVNRLQAMLDADQAA